MLLGKLVYFLGIMTIEPMMFVQGLASGISGIATEQMVLYKICRGKSIKPRPVLKFKTMIVNVLEEKYNLTQEYCANIELHTDDPIYSDVEKEVISFNNIIAITEHTIPILLSFYIGSWSDRFGRKPFLAFCMIGKTLGAVGNLFAAIFLDKMDRWIWLAVYLPVQNISGGVLTFIMMTYSFITDNSSPRSWYLITTIFF